jgi:hypothetical protein
MAVNSLKLPVTIVSFRLSPLLRIMESAVALSATTTSQ